MIWALLTLAGDPVLWTGIAFALAFAGLLHRWLIRHPWRHEWGRHMARFGLILAITLLVTFLAVDILKARTDIPRPCIPCSTGAADCNQYCLPDGSFPSGHAATASVVAAIGIFSFRRRERWLLLLLLFLVSASRLALGVHTPADVAGGVAAGLAISLLVWRLLGKRFFPFLQ